MPYKDPAKRREANKLNARKLRAKDPEKYRQSVRGWYGRNLEKARAYQRKKACASKGITVEQFDQMIEEQGYKCKICEKSFEDFYTGKEGPKIDHCHDTGAVRGLLCNRCNRALGFFEDNAELLLKAARYLS